MLLLDSVKLEMRLASACRLLSPDAFSTMLDLVHEGVPSKSGLGGQEVANLVRLSSILLREAPEGKGSHDLNVATVFIALPGTSKVCQAHTTKCLHLFADDERFTAVPCLRREALDFLVRQCNDRVSDFAISLSNALLTIYIARVPAYC